EGQALDIGWARDNRFDLEISDYLVMARHKTAYYSGGVPLAVGAIIGDGTEKQIEDFREFGMGTGLAFQIQDDLLNLVGEKESTFKDFRNDITEGKRTLVAVHALQHSNERDELIRILCSRTEDQEELAQAVGIMERAGSIDFANEYAVSLTAHAKERISDSLPQTPARDLLLSMADFFINRMR
ncbi:MAG: polyprenyl synthetase family protein, partial [Actinobacteria bacterium]|nr:polyprenyl synthetase family protein [Actinomycetota bacterium]